MHSIFCTEGLKHWKLVTNDGDSWKVEKAPKGCHDFPKDVENDKIKVHTSCFATTYNSCSKEQIIDLKKEGAVSQIMDRLQPKVTVSEWCVLLLAMSRGAQKFYQNFTSLHDCQFNSMCLFLFFVLYVIEKLILYLCTSHCTT